MTLYSFRQKFCVVVLRGNRNFSWRSRAFGLCGALDFVGTELSVNYTPYYVVNLHFQATRENSAESLEIEEVEAQLGPGRDDL